MSIDVSKSFPLVSYTTFRIGGLARYFAEVKSQDELVEACRWAKTEGQKVFILGGGSNVLISDAGFDGLVIFVNAKGMKYKHVDGSGEVLVEVQAGENWDDFVADSVARGYQGVECLSGIPGKVGGAAVQNIGAYGQEVSEVINRVRYYDLEKQAFKEFANSDCKFAYRQSVFKGKSGKIVVSVGFKLLHNFEPNLKYMELAEKFAGQKPSLARVRQMVLEIRKTKSMLADPNDADSVSVGSFFKNVVVDKELFIKTLVGYPNIPNWPQKDGTVKLSTGWLIERSGLPRGYIYKDGNVGLSRKTALAIINRGKATAEEVREFSIFIQYKVQETFDIKLEREAVFVGFD